MNGIQNFLNVINENYVTIFICIGLVIGVIKMITIYVSKQDAEKLGIVKEQLTQIMLKLVSNAEEDYEAWNKAGSIKRSQVIELIYSKYPILSKFVNQSEITAWIDEQIDNALGEIKKVFDNNKIVTE